MFKTVKALYCDECGDLICSHVEKNFESYTEGVDYYEIDGKYLCATCGNTLCEQCEICDETHFTRDMICNENICGGLYVCKDCFLDTVYPSVKAIFEKIHGGKPTIQTETKASLKSKLWQSELENLGTNEPWRIDPVAARMANY